MLLKRIAISILACMPISSFAFMSTEHVAMGDAISLPFSATEVDSGASAQLDLPDGIRLTYGQIIALAGDYFADVGRPFNAGTGKAIAEQPTEEAREHEFLVAFATLAANPHKHMIKTVTGHLTALFNQHLAALQKTYPNSFAAVYKPNTSKWVKQYVLKSHGRNLVEPFRLANDDHFAPAALKAYHAAHRVAIKTALEGYKAKQANNLVTARKDLELAYAENAFGCHYLTDAFAAGHMRTPRKALQDHFKKTGVILMGYMHDQDNATGLRVHNSQGKEWVAYGDQHYFDAADKTNRQMIHQVLQTSINSIYKAYNTGKDLNKNETDLFALMPNYQDLANYKKYHNPAPMFFVDNKNQMQYLEDGKYQVLPSHHAGVKVLFHRLKKFGRPM